MAEATTYTNDNLVEKIESALRPFDAQVVTLDLGKEATVRDFVQRVEDAYSYTRENPVKLSLD